jgi:hypothetical protein
MAAAAQVPPPFKPASDSATRPAAKIPAAALVAPARPDTAAVKPARVDSAKADTGRAEAQPAPDTRRKLKFEFYEIDDAELLADLWRLTGRADAAEEGHYQVLKVRDDSVAHAYLLREGTQVGRLPDSVVAGLRRLIRTPPGQKEGRVSQSLLGNFWNPIHPLAPFQWPTGIYVELLHAATIVRKSTPEIEQTYGGWVAARPVPWAHVEIGMYQSRYAGGLSRNLYNPLDNR